MERGMVSVDRWSNGSQVYFLTHLHADHTVGLTSTWIYGPLFCSRVTAKLFSFKFPGFKLSLLRVLDIGHWHSLSLVSPSSGLETTVEAMAIDAHHCPGAVMYLFLGEFGCMLYTGDFRWEKRSKRAQIGRTMLLNAVKNEKINILYLDNTYCNPQYSFPSREVAAHQVVNIITSYPEHDIIIGIDSLGKEDLLLHISRVLNIKIWVWPERLQTMHLLGFCDIFTTKTSLTRVRAVPRYSFSIDTLEGLNTIRPTIGIIPSGLPWALKIVGGNHNPFGASSISGHGRGSRSTNVVPCTSKTMPNRNLRTVERYHQFIYSVPYSDHSCFSELQEFVKLLQPLNIKGIVSSSPCYVDPLYYFGHLCGANQPSPRLCQKRESNDGGERVEAVQAECNIVNGDSAEAERKRKRTTQVDTSSVRVSRVGLLRRERRGAKIVETDFAD